MARAKIAGVIVLSCFAEITNSVIYSVSRFICAIGNSYREFVAVRFHVARRAEA